MFKSISTILRHREESLATRANRRLMMLHKGNIQKRIMRISSKKYNIMMGKAVSEYNKTHKGKLFNE